MATSHGDGSRIEAAEAGAHDSHGSDDSHGSHDVAAGGHGHGADPNAGVLVATPPTPAWVLTAAGIALFTVLVCVVLAILIPNSDNGGAGGDHGGSAPAEAPGEAPAEAPAEEPAHGLGRITLTSGRA